MWETKNGPTALSLLYFLKVSTKGPFIFISPLPFNCLFLEKFCRYSHIQQCANVSGKAFTLSVAIDKTNSKGVYVLAIDF